LFSTLHSTVTKVVSVLCIFVRHFIQYVQSVEIGLGVGLGWAWDTGTEIDAPAFGRST
jgi:hypothetical protein